MFIYLVIVAAAVLLVTGLLSFIPKERPSQSAIVRDNTLARERQKMNAEAEAIFERMRAERSAPPP